jgi:hypothetical protein
VLPFRNSLVHTFIPFQFIWFNAAELTRHVCISHVKLYGATLAHLVATLAKVRSRAHTVTYCTIANSPQPSRNSTAVRGVGHVTSSPFSGASRMSHNTRQADTVGFCNLEVRSSNSGPETGHRSFVGFPRLSKHTGMVSRIHHDHFLLRPFQFVITTRRCNLKQPRACVVTEIVNTDLKATRTLLIVYTGCRWTKP